MKNYIVKIKICDIKKRDTVVWITETELEWDKVPQGKERLLSWIWRASKMNSLHGGANVSGTASHAEGTPCSKDIVFLSYGQQSSISLTCRWKPNAAAPLDPSTPSFLFPLHLIIRSPSVRVPVARSSCRGLQSFLIKQQKFALCYAIFNFRAEWLICKMKWRSQDKLT